MKKIFISFMILGLIPIATVQAQLEKGRILIGVTSTLNKELCGSDLANLGYSVSKIISSTGDENDADKRFGFNIIPSAGYFLIDNLAAGINFTVSYDRYKSEQMVYNTTDVQLCAVPFVRYYYPLEKLYPFAELSGGIGKRSYTQENSSSENTDKWGVTQLGGGVGVALPLGEKITFDVMAGYNRLTYKIKDEDPDNEYTTIYGSFGLKVGFTAYLNL